MRPYEDPPRWKEQPSRDERVVGEVLSIARQLAREGRDRAVVRALKGGCYRAFDLADPREGDEFLEFFKDADWRFRKALERARHKARWYVIVFLDWEDVVQALLPRDQGGHVGILVGSPEVGYLKERVERLFLGHAVPILRDLLPTNMDDMKPCIVPEPVGSDITEPSEELGSEPGAVWLEVRVFDREPTSGSGLGYEVEPEAEAEPRVWPIPEVKGDTGAPDIFISPSLRTVAFAMTLALYIRVILGRRVTVSRGNSQRSLRQLAQAKVFVACISEEFSKSVLCNLEAAFVIGGFAQQWLEDIEGEKPARTSRGYGQGLDDPDSGEEDRPEEAIQIIAILLGRERLPKIFVGAGATEIPAPHKPSVREIWRGLEKALEDLPRRGY